MSEPISPSVTDFLIRLKKIDLRQLTVRDICVLYVVITKPGCSGMEVSAKLGIKDRSAIASNLHRLIREGYIEDRREHQRKAYATILHVLPRGLEFWEEIKP
jgi:DNA-binding MarR family transcriptional regulator